MPLAPLPEEILDRFRTSSRNRLSQVASTWKAATIGHATDAMLVEMHRHVHTLKGDARMVQFQDIDLVCQKLEDLLAAAGELRYRVTPDVDLSVSMALDFIGLLLRRRGDQQVSGIDLDGFVAQVHQALRGQASNKTRAPRLAGGEAGAGASAYEGSGQTRARLASAATRVFLEYLSAAGVARTRLRGVWRDLQHELEQMDSVALAPMIERQVVAARSLASDMGLALLVDSTCPSEQRVSALVAQALDVALLHSVRNALGHGIAGGDKSEGRLSIVVKRAGDMLTFEVRDNGRGIDVEEIRQRAVASDSMHPDLAKTASREDLLALLFESQFTTRDHIDAISGRGLGLDVVRDAIRGVGGDVAIEGTRGAGAVLTMRVPVARRELEIHMFDAYGGRLMLGVEATWAVQSVDFLAASNPVDPLQRLQVRRPKDETGLVQAGPPHILRFVRDESSMDLVAAKSTREVLACRICSTPESFPAEVVTVDGTEVLLLRLDKLPSVIANSDESTP